MKIMKTTNYMCSLWKTIPCFSLLNMFALCDTVPLPMSVSAWDADPIVWRFDAAQNICTVKHAGRDRGIAVFEIKEGEWCADVTVGAVFTPTETLLPGWCVAGVAIVMDEDNFWHIALVRGPREDGSAHNAELCEMRDGKWLAHVGLPHGDTSRFSETRFGWEYGKPYKFTLTLNWNGVRGEITGPDGEIVLRESFAFTGNVDVVRYGNPALRASGFSGIFADVRMPEEIELVPPPPPRYFGNTFYSVLQDKDGRWSFDNGLGFLLGIDHVKYEGHGCEALGYNPHGRKNDAKYHSREKWEDETLERLKSWGFNATGAGSDVSLRGRKDFAWCDIVGIGEFFASYGDEYAIMDDEKRPCSAFPNVFHPDFPAYARYLARRVCAPYKNDTSCVGWFIDNELRWWGEGHWGSAEGLFEAAMAKPDGHHAKEEAKKFDDKIAFLRHVADTYFRVCAEAIRAAAPNHFVLGARFAGTESAAPVVWEVAGEHCDIVSFNYYPYADLDEGKVFTHLRPGGEPVATNFARYAALCKRPMMVTEWSFPALDAGLPCLHGAGQRFDTQAERARATELFAREMLAMPFIIGYNYFMWVDQPALGISANFPEDSNYGLVNEDNVPYPEITAVFSNLHRRVPGLRAKIFDKLLNF